MKNKIFIIITLFVGFIVFILFSSLFLLEKSTINSLSIEQLEKKKSEKINYFNEYIKNKRIIVEALAKNKYLNEFIANGSNKKVVEDIFLTFANGHSEIFQFRFIDLNGNEIIRVDNYSNVVLVKEKKLQNKKNRYYFEETLNKNDGEIYYSNIDLNVEEGKIELPIVPTLRIGTPIVINGEKKGIVIININLREFLNNIQKASLHYVNLIYDDAHIIVNRNSENNWSRDYKLEKNLFQMYSFLPKDFIKFNYLKSDNFFIAKLPFNSKNKIYMFLVPKEFEKYSLLNKNMEYRIYLIIAVILLILPIGYFISLYIENAYKKMTLFKKAKTDNILFNSVINSTKDLIFYKDKYFKYIGCNKAFEEFVGKPSCEIIGKNDFELFDEEYAILFREKDEELLKENKIIVSNEWVKYPNHKKVYLQTQKIPFDYDKTEDNGILGISRDITDLYLANKKIKEQTYIDELTKVYNRKSFNKKINEIFDLYKRYNTSFCIAMYDIDNFKKINDEYGHDVGDKVLIEMSQKVRSLIRKTDNLFRIGGEEFVILFPTSNIGKTYEVVEKIRIAVSNMTMVEDKKITISFGLTKPEENDNIKTICKRVDTLLYESKNNGKNITTLG